MINEISEHLINETISFNYIYILKSRRSAKEFFTQWIHIQALQSHIYIYENFLKVLLKVCLSWIPLFPFIIRLFHPSMGFLSSTHPRHRSARFVRFIRSTIILLAKLINVYYFLTTYIISVKKTLIFSQKIIIFKFIVYWIHLYKWTLR